MRDIKGYQDHAYTSVIPQTEIAAFCDTAIQATGNRQVTPEPRCGELKLIKVNIYMLPFI